MRSLYFAADERDAFGRVKTSGSHYWGGTADFHSVAMTRPDRIGDILSKQGGSFCAALDCKDEVFLFADCIRSIPLFYSVTDTEVVVGSNAECVADRLKTARLHKGNINEFLACGYVTEDQTIFKDIYQVLPGGGICIGKETGGIQKRQYFELLYGADSKEQGLEAWMEEYDEVLKQVFASLIKRLNGRTAAIPLSGGCDSRTAAVMLKRLGYEKVICFSYGRAGCMEAAYAEKVAKALNYQWLFVEYHAECWRNFYNSPDYRQFLQYSCLGSGIGCVQALPAVLRLKRNGLLPEDAVVIPGHAQDMAAGSKLKYGKTHITKAGMTEEILRSNYFLQTGLRWETAIEKWTKNIPEFLGEKVYISALQLWEWKNRQSKFTANDVRAYEYAGYDWELPFWDRRNCEFWMSVPEELLYGRYLQYEHMKRYIDTICRLKIVYPTLESKRKLQKLRVAFSSKLRTIAPWLVDIKKKKELLAQHYTNQDAFYDFMSDEELKRYIRKYGVRFNINSLVAEEYIKGIYKNYQ